MSRHRGLSNPRPAYAPQAVSPDGLPESAVKRRHLLCFLEQAVAVEHDEVAEPMRHVPGVVGAAGENHKGREEKKQG